MPFEEWIYGRPPSDIEFVRINRIASSGSKTPKSETPVIFTKTKSKA